MAIPDLARDRVRSTSFQHTFAATPSALASLRARLREWLRELPLHEDLVQSTVLSVSEAAANSIEHGLRFDVRGIVTVAGLVRENGVVELTVGDDGSWREPSEQLENRGYGLRIIHAVMDDVGIERRSTGTVVRLGVRSAAS
jgi:anti-sigma regulatory factor (Ser/Thr protein kinase)